MSGYLLIEPIEIPQQGISMVGTYPEIDERPLQDEMDLWW